MVVYEAASAIVHMPHCTARELAPAVSGQYVATSFSLIYLNNLKEHNGAARRQAELFTCELFFCSAAAILQFPKSCLEICCSQDPQQGTAPPSDPLLCR